MADLFDQLKSAGPVKKTNSAPAKSISQSKSNFKKTVEQLNEKQKSKSSGKVPESLPSPIINSQSKSNFKNTLEQLNEKQKAKSGGKRTESLPSPITISESKSNFKNSLEQLNEKQKSKSSGKNSEPLPSPITIPQSKSNEKPKSKSSGKRPESLPSPITISQSKSNIKNTLEQFNEKQKSKSSGKRRESLPSPITVSSVLKKTKSHKARSLSPPKYGGNNIIKSLKVKLERKKLEEFLTRPLEEHANNIRKKQEKAKDANKHPKMTPTKAQQKLFEPVVIPKKAKTQIVNQFNIKPFKVRIRRDNLQKLLLPEFKYKKADKKDDKSKNSKKRPASSTTSNTESPPTKKGKLSVDNKINKSKNSFFIKLNTSPPGKMEKKLKNLSRISASSEALYNKIKNSKFSTTTAPTKFSRSQLLRSFGKRFFNVHVKIERCTHPLMLTFESNNRARRLQSKRNKSKNLSVSFREQVEIFGGSSDSDDSCDEDFCAVPSNRNNRKNNASQPSTVAVTPIVMPARLKKVENGKVVDDIELDPSLFVDPKIFVSSTPFSPGRKKRDHKSFSPLKDESSPSPRKEQLKLANEKIPPTGLRRLNIEEDDEDDDCEYIVPTEMPDRRTSRTSSNTTLDDLISAPIPLPDPTLNFPELFDDDIAAANKINFNANTNNAEISKFTENNTDKLNVEKSINLDNDSNESFQSAKDNTGNDNEKNDQYPSLRISPTFGLQLALETNKCDEFEQLQQTNGSVCNETRGKHLNTLNAMDDISMNLLWEATAIK